MPSKSNITVVELIVATDKPGLTRFPARLYCAERKVAKKRVLVTGIDGYIGAVLGPKLVVIAAFTGSLVLQ